MGIVAEQHQNAVLEVRGVCIGTGMPKTIVSLMGTADHELAQQARRAIAAGTDCLEWRADFYDSLSTPNDVRRSASRLREAAPSAPLIFTFRSKNEGGQRALAHEDYADLCEAAIRSGAIDLVDVELNRGDELVRRLVHLAHAHGVLAVVSYHDFAATPSTDHMVELLERMSHLGADIPKLAVMAHDSVDALRLMQATAKARDSLGKPLLTMAMGPEGVLSRLAGEAFGSCLTFCAVGTASAPGQVELAQATRTLQCLHEAL